MKAITDLAPADLQSEWEAAGIPPFRARQVFAWVWKGAASFDDMTDLPKALRERLAKGHTVLGARIAESPKARDATRKYLLELADGKRVECVLIPAAGGRYTACLSSQVGCPLACGFCASGLDGVERNLTSGEIVDQYLILKRACQAEITNVVFMGMGEPMLNLDNVLSAIDRLTDQKEGALGARRITISTSGIVPGIRKLADDPRQIRLSVSLHAARDDLRTRIMPINRKYPLAALKDALQDYQAGTDRLVTFEYILLDGVNDSPRESKELADLVSAMDSKVNLIPFNSVPETPYQAPPRHRCDAFTAYLKSRGLRVTLRVRKGADIDAACGQLRLRKSETGIHHGDTEAQRTKNERFL